MSLRFIALRRFQAGGSSFTSSLIGFSYCQAYDDFGWIQDFDHFWSRSLFKGIQIHFI